MQKNENQITIELIRYYQQKDALINQKESYKEVNNLDGYNITMMHYDDKIKTLKNQLNEINPEKLEEILQKRANDCTVNGAIEIGAKSNQPCE